MSWIDVLRERAGAWFRGAQRDRELELEIEHHLTLETQRQLDAGYEPREARARALARFGDRQHITDATREARGEPLMEGGMQDLHWAMRSLRKNAGFTALALVTIALGIGTTTAAFTVFDTVLLRPLPYRHADRLVLIHERTDKNATLPPSFPNFVDWRTRARPFDAVASIMFPFGITVWPSATGAEPVRAQLLGVSRGFFAAIGVPLAAGREFTEAENAVGGARVVMVTYEFWRDQLGKRQPLGTMRWGDNLVDVVGVAPEGFRFLFNADAFFPHEQWPGTIRSAHNYMVVGRLRPDVSLDAARSEMTALSKVMRAEFGDETQAVDVDMQPLRDYVVGNFRVLLATVFSAAAMVLLIACVNLLSAQLARGWAREHEMVVRVALGASRGRIVRQLCIETLSLVATGAALGIGAAFALVSGIKILGIGLLPRLAELHVDARSLIFATAVTIVTTGLVGLYPALRSARNGAAPALRAGGSRETIRTSLWRALIGVEVALAVVLVVGSGLLIRTLHNILNADTGIDARGVLTASFAPEQSDFNRLNEITRELGAIPGVNGVAFASRLPFTWGNTAGPVRRPGDSRVKDWPAMAGFRVVSPEYFTVVRQPIVAGRSFSATDNATGAGVAIITSGIADKLWPGQDAVGKQIATNYLFDEWLTVVGVVAEATSWSMPRGGQNEIYVPLSQHPKSIEGQLIAVLRTSGDPKALTATVRARLRELTPRSPPQIGTLVERIERTAADRRFGMLALSMFGLVGLMLAGIGIYGVMWYIVTTRTREIGIRMALGATSSLVRRQTVLDAVAMTAVGVVAGAVMSIFATRYLEASLYGVSRLDPSTFAAGATVAMVAALVGAYVPARRSSRVDPMVAIRSE